MIRPSLTLSLILLALMVTGNAVGADQIATQTEPDQNTKQTRQTSVVQDMTTDNPDPVAIGMLLPAVQAAREAARR